MGHLLTINNFFCILSKKQPTKDPILDKKVKKYVQSSVVQSIDSGISRPIHISGAILNVCIFNFNF